MLLVIKHDIRKPILSAENRLFYCFFHNRLLYNIIKGEQLK